MIYKVADSVVSAFGSTTKENYNAVCNRLSAVTDYPLGERGVPFPFKASLMDPFQIEELATMITGARTHLMPTIVNMLNAAYSSAVSSFFPPDYMSLFGKRRIALILACGKDYSYMNKGAEDADKSVPNSLPWFVAHKFISNADLYADPFVIANYTISSCQAQLLAHRLLTHTSLYDYAVVLSENLVSPYISSGLKAFERMSSAHIYPYDKRAEGMNIGEAAACAIYTNEKTYKADMSLYLHPAKIAFLGGFMSNDATSVLDSSNSNELYRVVEKTLKVNNVNKRDIAFITGSGEAIPEYDNKESLAIEKAGLSKIPVNAYTANFGFLGAASSLVASIISCKALENNMLLPTLGCNTLGVKGKMTVATIRPITSNKSPYFLKMDTCFGGCNGAALFRKVE